MPRTISIPALTSFGVFAAVGFYVCHIRNEQPEQSSKALRESSTVRIRGAPQSSALTTVTSVVLKADVLSLDQLRLAIADVKKWQRTSNRTQIIQAAFRHHAKTRGVSLAIRDACEVFGSPRLPRLLRETGIEVAAISCLEVGGATEAELASLLSDHAMSNGPLLRAFAFSIEPRNVCDIYSHLRGIMDQSEVKSDRALGQLIFAVAIQAAADCKPSDLSSLAKLANGMIDNDEIISLIAAATYAFDRDLALKFVVEQAANDSGRLAKFVRELKLPPEALAAFCKKLSPGDLSAFASRYAAQVQKGNPLLYTELAMAVGPTELPVNLRSQIISGLLKVGGGDALAWLEALPAGERAAALSNAYEYMVKQPGTRPTPEAWLEAASKCEGVDEKQIATAIRAASTNIEWDTARSYAKLLSPKMRAGVERDLYLSEISKLVTGDRDAMLAFVDSAPTALKPGLLQYAADSVVSRTPDRALKWYDETSDPAAKKALEDAILRSSNLTKVPLQTRGAWIEERIKDGNYLTRSSPAVNNYIRDLSATDAAAALAFVKALPESNLRNDAFREMAREWAYRDPVSASKWIVELPEGQSRDFALSELTKASRDEPESAFVNVTAISDPRLRLQAATAVVEWWKTRDAAKVDALISQSALTAEEKAKLLQVLGK